MTPFGTTNRLMENSVKENQTKKSRDGDDSKIRDLALSFSSLQAKAASLNSKVNKLKPLDTKEAVVRQICSDSFQYVYKKLEDEATILLGMLMDRHTKASRRQPKHNHHTEEVEHLLQNNILVQKKQETYLEVLQNLFAHPDRVNRSLRGLWLPHTNSPRPLILSVWRLPNFVLRVAASEHQAYCDMKNDSAASIEVTVQAIAEVDIRSEKSRMDDKISSPSKTNHVLSPITSTSPIHKIEILKCERVEDEVILVVSLKKVGEESNGVTIEKAIAVQVNSRPPRVPKVFKFENDCNNCNDQSTTLVAIKFPVATSLNKEFPKFHVDFVVLL